MEKKFFETEEVFYLLREFAPEKEQTLRPDKLGLGEIHFFDSKKWVIAVNYDPAICWVVGVPGQQDNFPSAWTGRIKTSPFSLEEVFLLLQELAPQEELTLGPVRLGGIKIPYFISKRGIFYSTDDGPKISSLPQSTWVRRMVEKVGIREWPKLSADEIESLVEPFDENEDFDEDDPAGAYWRICPACYGDCLSAPGEAFCLTCDNTGEVQIAHKRA